MASQKDRGPSSWLPTPPWEGLPPLLGLPWERQGHEEPRVSRRAGLDHPHPKPASAGPIYLGGPGCRAADSCLLVHGYLVHLAEGKSGFGVLQVAKERLEEGAAAASQLGKAQLAQEMRAVAEELTQVRTPEAAATMAPRLKELADQTWDLGRRCGGHFRPETIAMNRSPSSGERLTHDLTHHMTGGICDTPGCYQGQRRA